MIETEPPIPFAGCSAAMKCVSEEFCDAQGVMVNTPVVMTDIQKLHRTPMMACLNTDTNQVGFCCRDPLYEDPWPADMPMPMMPKPNPPAPVVPIRTTAAPVVPIRTTPAPVRPTAAPPAPVIPIRTTPAPVQPTPAPFRPSPAPPAPIQPVTFPIRTTAAPVLIESPAENPSQIFQLAQCSQQQDCVPEFTCNSRFNKYSGNNYQVRKQISEFRFSFFFFNILYLLELS